MFKLLTIIFMLVAIGTAYPEPEGHSFTIIASGRAASSATTATPDPAPTPVQSNAISESEENTSDSDDDEQQQPAPASVTRSSATSLSVSSAVSRASVVISSSGRSGSIIQHHILPAEAIPLPITISTRAGIRTVIAPETITIHEPTVAKVGEVVQKIPTAVSHQSQTIVHKHARVVTPIVAPAVRTITSQVFRAYHTPIVYTPQSSAVVRVVSHK